MIYALLVLFVEREFVSENSLIQPANQPASTNRFLPLILILFFGSGSAALIYEIVWFQLLQLMIGSSSISLGVLLGIYMGGMCLGSLVLPRIISARRHPLRVYALQVAMSVQRNFN